MIKRSYWDIDDILAEEEPISIKISNDLNDLGFLSSSDSSKILTESTRLTIPLWLAERMATRGMATIEVPKFFGESYKNTLEADPRIISLKDRSSYFFEVGGKLNNLLEGANLIELLLKVFIARVIYVFSEISQNSDPRIMKKLTELEMEIYEKGMKTVREVYDWRERKFDMIRASTSVAKSTKKIKLS